MEGEASGGWRVRPAVDGGAWDKHLLTKITIKLRYALPCGANVRHPGEDGGYPAQEHTSTTA